MASRTISTVQMRIVILLVLSQACGVLSAGVFYVGLLTYDNDDFRGCCEKKIGCDEYHYCNLLFEIQVAGLNGSAETQTWRSDSILSPMDAVIFSSEKFPNPLHFDFYIWEGNANVSVNIYNKEDDGTEKLVDAYQGVFNYHVPSDYYVKDILQSDTTNTNLSIVYRYKCGLTEGQSCFSDCIDHLDNETCPPTVSPSSNVVTISGLFPNQNTSCETPGCKPDITTDAASDLNVTTDSAEETTTVTTTTTTTLTTTTDNALTKDIETTIKDNNKHSTNKEATTDDDRVTTPSILNSTHSPIKPLHQTTSIPTSSEPLSTPDERIKYVDNNTPYWPAIVGGVLGAVALFAAAGFICYFNRQKKLQKRQEIYNVNPKVLRNFEEYTENGISGRADVPMETEQY